MAETSGSDWSQLKITNRLGAGAKGQSCDGTFTAGNLPAYGITAADGTTTDSGILAASVALKSAIQQEAYTYAADTGTANAYAVTLSPAPTIIAGSEVVFKGAHANTGASTLAVNGGAAVAITKNGTTALASGDIAAGQIVTAKYDGTQWQITAPVTPVSLTSGVTGVLPVANGGTGTATPGILAGANVTVTGTWPNQTVASTGGGGAITTFTNPTQSLFTFYNAGSPTLTNTSAGITGVGPVSAFVSGFRTAGLTAPWNVEAGFLCILGNENYYSVGINLRAGASGVAECFGIQWNSSGFIFFLETLTSSLAYNSTPQTRSATMFGGWGPTYLRVRDDGTNRYFEISADCVLWLTIFHETRTTWGTMDRGGFEMTASPSYNLAARLIHYKEY